MTEILLDYDFNTNINKTFFFYIRAQTLTILPNLDVNRKRNIITFLYEIRLNRSDEVLQVDLNGITFWSSSSVRCRLEFLYLPAVYLSV